MYGDTLTTFADNLVEAIDLNEPDFDEDLLVVGGQMLGTVVLGPADAAHIGGGGGLQLGEIEIAKPLNDILCMF